jgi:hypothetical protein
MPNLFQFLSVSVPDLWLFAGGMMVGVVLMLLVIYLVRAVILFVQRHWKLLVVGAALFGALGFWL